MRLFESLEAGDDVKNSTPYVSADGIISTDAEGRGDPRFGWKFGRGNSRVSEGFGEFLSQTVP